MAEREKRPQEVLRKHGRFYEGGAFFIVITAFIIILFTGGIAYGVQSLMGGEAVEGVLVDGVVEFRMSEQQWAIKPASIKVNPGDTVRFINTSMDIEHGFAINELGINLTLPSGEMVLREVVVPPDIAEGIYTMYCSVFCGIGHPYMKGNITIGTPELLFGVGLGKILPYVATLVTAVMFVTIIAIGERRAR